MDSSGEETVITKELWRAWEARDRRRDRETARRLKLLAGIVMGLVAIGSAVYFQFSK